jgi:hypothetical protein
LLAGRARSGGWVKLVVVVVVVVVVGSVVVGRIRRGVT